MLSSLSDVWSVDLVSVPSYRTWVFIALPLASVRLINGVLCNQHLG